MKNQNQEVFIATCVCGVPALLKVDFTPYGTVGDLHQDIIGTSPSWKGISLTIGAGWVHTSKKDAIEYLLKGVLEYRRRVEDELFSVCGHQATLEKMLYQESERE